MNGKASISVSLGLFWAEMIEGNQVNKLDEDLLATLPPFAQLTRSDIRHILDQASAERFAPGACIFEEGAAAERFYLLLDGYISVARVTPEGEQVIVLHIPSGHLFGIAAALGHKAYPATSFAANECYCLHWPMKLLEGFLQTYPGFSAGLYSAVGQRLNDVNTRLVEIATQQVEQRIANALLRMISQAGRVVDGGVEIDFPITRQQISEMTGSTLHTVSRMLSAWEREGIIKSARKKITVTDKEQLTRFAG